MPPANEQIILVQYCKPLLGQWNFNIGLILGHDCNVVWVFGFLLTTHVKTNANKMCLRSSHPMRHFRRVYLHTQTAVHTHLTNHGCFNHGKLKYPQLEPNAGIKMTQVLGSLAYICGYVSFPLTKSKPAYLICWEWPFLHSFRSSSSFGVFFLLFLH